MRFAVETWAPDYGAPVGGEALEPASSEVDESVEVPIDHWLPLRPEPGTPPIDDLLFVDGVRRVDAHVWITDDDGVAHQGICASYAAGAVHCNGAARLVEPRVERALLAPAVATGAAAIGTRHGTYALVPAAADDHVELPLLLQRKMGELEAAVVRAVPEHEVVVVDGPLRPGQTDPEAVGYIKTHRRAYGRPMVRDTIAALGIGERTPIILLGGIAHRFTWYQRLPGPVRHGWAGVVRLEAPATEDLAVVTARADRLCVTLGRFASAEQKDPRAPQNLYPVGGLERELRRRLGDPQVLYRALREAQFAISA